MLSGSADPQLSPSAQFRKLMQTCLPQEYTEKAEIQLGKVLPRQSAQQPLIHHAYAG